MVLQNLNTEEQQTVTNDDTGINLDTNIYFSTSVNPSNLTHLILFGTAGQTIYAKFNLTGTQSDAITATEVSSGQYSFDLSTVVGTSSMAPAIYTFEIRDFNVGAALFTTSNATMTTVNSSGFVGEGYDGSTFQFQFETTAVPEPGTLILTGSALAAGAVGAYFKRRRKARTEAETAA